MPVKKSRNYYIELLRFIFTIPVIITHFNSVFDNNVLVYKWHGHMSVEFFFVLSGYLMASYAAKRENGEPVWRETWVFIKKKFLGIAPVYYAAFLIVVIRYLIVTPLNGNKFMIFISRLLTPAFMLPSIGFNESVSVPFSWYIGSMIFSMFIIFPFLYKFGKTFKRIAAPLITVFFVAFAMQTYGYIAVLKENWYGICFPQLFRALGEICLGCAAYELSVCIKKRFENRLTNIGRGLFTAISLALFAALFAWIVFGMDRASQLCVLFLFALGIAIAFTGLDFTYKLAEWKWSSKLLGWLGSISLGCYLGQGIVMYWFPKELAGEKYGVYLYVGACVLMGIVLFYGSKLLVLLFRLIKKLFTKLCIKETA